MIDPGGTPLPPSSRATAEQDVARRVAQGEKGLPLQEWATTRVEPALRPDGSLVYVAANHAVEGLDDDPAAPAPAEPATGADNDAEITADPVPYVEPVDYRPTGSVTVPSGLKARAQANIDALRVAHLCAEQNRAATPDEQEVLVQWSGWGALPGMFADDHDVLADERAELRELLDEKTWRAARASTVNAHYTDPAIARQMWEAVTAAGFTDGRVLEPGCGSGNFLGFAPEKAVTVGVELDPTTAQIAHLLYPSAQIRPEGFEKTRLPDGAFALSIGNVPFGAFEVPDPIYNSGRHHIHNYFIHKSLALTAPGGYVAVLTSKGTMDAGGPKARAARQAIHDKADLVGAVRLPTGAFRRVAGTEVVTDVLIFRRRELDLPVPAEPAWLDTVDLPVRDRDGDQVDLPINRYFVDHPQNVLGQLRADRGLYREGELTVSSSSSPEQVSVELGARLRQIVTDAKDRGHGLTANADSLRAAEVTTTAGLATSADLTRDAGEMPIGRLRWNAAADTFERRGLGGIEPVTLPKSRVTETRHLLQLREVAELAITTQRSTSATAADKEANRRELNKLYDSYVAKYGPINRFKVQGGRERTEEEQQTRFAKLEAEWRERNSDEQGWSYAGDLPERVADDLLDKSWAATPRSTRQTHLDALRGDPSITALLALERYEVDEDAGTVKVSKAQIFTRDVVAPPVKVTRADSPDQALSIVLAESPEHINLDRVAELRGLNSAEEAREDLGNLVYTDIDDPTRLVTATRLLSGDMRAKVDRARAQLDADPGNVGLAQSLEAITAKVPETLEAARIKVKISAPWISTSDYEQFATEVFGADRTTIDHHHDGTYSVQCFNSPDTAKMRSEFGADNSDRTKALSAIDLYQMLLNQQSIKVENSSEAVKERGLPRIDMQATTLAQVQAGKINDEFRRWLWEDPDRKARLVDEYNRRFNTLVPTSYDGSFLQLDGVSEAFTPHPYQRDAVARIVAEPSALLDHVVGAGKTGSMFMGAMELRRRGLVRQPWIVVPTHLIEQMGREAKQWYPAAQILVGWKAMNEDARKLFVAQSAASDWDFVIIPSSVFEKISVHPDRRSEYIQQQLDALDRAEPTTTAGIKRVEKAKNTLKAKLEKALTESDKTKAIVHFEESGCDYLLVDEAHLYKNLSRQCALEELALENGSAKADDLALKLQLLRDRQQDQARAEGRDLEPGTERVATFATGTPIANSMSEMWVMQQFLRPDLLRHTGVRSLTAWAGTFTTSASLILPNISGTKLQVVEKIAKFNNPDQLAQMSSIFADVVTRDQVPVPLPSIASGKRKVITTEPGIDVKDFIADFAHRVETADPRRPDLDNQLKVLSDGRNVALDPRLANLDPDPGNTRADAVAREVARIYHANSDREYEDPEGGMSPVRGATQIVFCDRGTPKKGQWSVYQGLRDSLTELGIPPEKVAFIHDAVKPSARLKLQADVRAGRVAVLIGSTEKMGTGLNVQDRLVALHHMDVPWRPADLEQREGRIIRQGNQNSEIELLTYVTTGTTDTVMWSKVETKAGYIAQMKRGGTGMDEIEDVGEITLAEEASAAKAAASGDPRFMRVAELDNESKRLEALAAAHQDSRSHARWVVNRNTKAIPARQKQLDVIVPLAEGAPAWAESGKPITVFIEGQPKSFAERKDRSMALLHACRAGYRAAKTGMDSVEVAQFPSGVSVRANRRFFDSALVLSMYAADKTALGVSVELPSAKLWPKAEGNENGLAAKAASDGQVASGLLTRLENAYADHLPDRIPWLQRELDGLAAEIEIQEPRIDAPFPDQEALNATRVELVQLRMDIEADKSTPEAIAAALEADERMRRNGRYPGWSLDLNPTPTLVEESGMEDKAAYVTAAIENMRQRAQEYAAEHDVAQQPELVASGGRALPVKAIQPAQNSRTTRRATGNRAERPTGPAGREEGGSELGR